MNTKGRIERVPLVLIMVVAQAPGLLLGAGTTDSERIINVEALRASLSEATSPIAQRINQSQLGEKFDQVNTLLQETEIDKERLLVALGDLRQEMMEFTENWSQLTDPLWQGQETIGQTIDKVRLLLARNSTGEPSEKVKALLENYDARLSELATSIKGEPDEDRKKRLKLIFANVLSLRQLTERAGQIDLGPAQQAVYARIIESLSNLEGALTQSTFQVERTRIVLRGQAQFIGDYADILKGLIDSEKLASVLADMNEAGDGLSVLAGDLNGLNGRIQDFTGHMNALAERLSMNIDRQAAPIVQMPEVEGVGADIDDMIERYSAATNETKGDSL